MQNNVKIAKQYLKELVLKNPNSPEIFTQAQDKPNIEVSINIDAKKLSDLAYEVILELKAVANNGNLFEILVNYGAICSIDEDSQGLNNTEELLLVECPTLLFPFARKVISDAVAEAGFLPLNLDPVDFNLIYQKRKQNVTIN